MYPCFKKQQIGDNWSELKIIFYLELSFFQLPVGLSFVSFILSNCDSSKSWFACNCFNSWSHLGLRSVGRSMMLKATFNNSSVKSWQSVLLVEETGGPWENTNLSQVTNKLYHTILILIIYCISCCQWSYF
jgi:hypothetical protein